MGKSTTEERAVGLGEDKKSTYPTLSEYSAPLKAAEREIIGREREIRLLMAAMMRPELSNVILLAEAGSGKTSLVQAALVQDTDRLYLEVDLAKMIANLSNSDEMASRLKALFDEAEAYHRDEGRELVLFIDEFHQVVQLSAAAVEALKPVLAASGTRGLRIIAATTYEEFRAHVAPNQPLVERLQRVSLAPPDRATTVAILRGMAERYEVADQFFDDRVFESIYEYTDRYMTSQAQPRKSILLLDAMVGWHRLTGAPMDRDLLAQVLRDTANIDVAFDVDATTIRERLDKTVLSQRLATATIAQRLQLCVADLHDKTRPISSFLFTGSSGVGKTEMTKQLARLLFGDDQAHLIRFDMSEFSNDDTFDHFRSILSSRVWARPHSVILFDEIEKASAKVVRLLLQILDDGRLSDDNGRQVSFLNAYIIMTTNAGSEIFSTIAQYNVDDTGEGKDLIKRMREIRNSISTTQGDNRFPPELLGRIDAIVPFQPLSRSTQESIVKNKMRAMRDEVMRLHGVKVEIHPDVLQYLIEDKGETDSDAGGARTAVARMTTDVTTQIAEFINKYPRERAIGVSVEGDMVSNDKNLLESDAHIVVRALR